MPAFLYNGTSLYGNHEFVDQIGELTNATATLFQRFDNGFVRITTNVRNERGERAVNTYISSSSPVIQAIERGQTFRGRAFVVDDWYLTIYLPILVDGQVEGILYVGVREKDLPEIKALFDSKEYFNTGYPYLVDKDGELIVHPTSEGSNISNEQVFQLMTGMNTTQGKMQYVWQGMAKTQYFRYYEPIESYVAVTLDDEQYLAVIGQIRNAIIVAVLLGILIFVFIFCLLSAVF